MVEEAHENGFNIDEVEADKAYCSRANYDFADEIGATAYIPFKSNATGRSGGSRVWNKMYHYFMMNREEVYGALPQEKQCRDRVYDGKDKIW